MTFEIIDKEGNRLRFEGDEKAWQYPSVEGKPDVLDKSAVEVIDGDGNVLLTVHSQLAVGDVDEYTSKIMPKERRETQCPRCGYCEFMKTDDEAIEELDQALKESGVNAGMAPSYPSSVLSGVWDRYRKMLAKELHNRLVAEN